MESKVILLLLGTVFLSACVQTIALRSTASIVDYGLEAINEEPDLELAEQSIAANLKLLEGLLKGEPENERLLLLACRGYSSYALGFAEDDSVERARTFYLRARDYGLRILRKKKELAQTLERDPESFRQRLSTLSDDDTPAAFWVANAWGNYVRLSLTDPAAVADLPKVEALFDFVLQHDESYFYGSAHLALGTLYGSRPKILGGNLEKARRHFERCLELSDGKFLLAYVYYAMTYATQVQDRQKFSSLLSKVEEASIELLPEQRLANAIAKKKARRLMEKISELFE